MRISSLQCRVMKIAVSLVVGAIVIDLASSPQAQEGQIRSCGRPRRAEGMSSCVACWARWTGSIIQAFLCETTTRLGTPLVAVPKLCAWGAERARSLR